MSELINTMDKNICICDFYNICEMCKKRQRETLEFYNEFRLPLELVIRGFSCSYQNDKGEWVISVDGKEMKPITDKERESIRREYVRLKKYYKKKNQIMIEQLTTDFNTDLELNSWEQNFIESVGEQQMNKKNLSEKQIEILNKIYNKYF